MIIEVKADSGKQETGRNSGRGYKINLKERAKNNKADIELLKLLREHFGKEVRIIKGLKSKNKIVEVE